MVCKDYISALRIVKFLFIFIDGTSTVTFLTFIGNYYKKEYIIPYYLGEAFSSMIPSIAGLIQGIG